METPLFTGKYVIELSEVDSTNDYAAGLLKKNNPPEGTIVFAYSQTKGKGQSNTTWCSNPGENITVSIIYYPTFLEAQKQFYLNEAISLGVFDFLSAHIKKENLAIKWPNDIYYNDCKICGILISNILSDKIIKASIIGIGININQEEFPLNIPNPTSLKIIGGKKYNLEDCLHLLLTHIEKRYLQLKDNNLQKLNKEFLLSLYKYGKPARFKIKNEEIIEGEITGLTEEGMLKVKTGDEIFTFNFKEISYII